MNKSLLALLFSTSLASATAQNTWVSWDGANISYNQTAFGVSYATSLTGSLNLPSSLGGSPITVSYSGEVASWSRLNGTGLNPFTNPTSFLSNSVTSGTPPSEYIAVTGFSGLTNTLTFSSPVTNLVMAIGSLGGNAGDAAYQFDQEFVVVSRGSGNWGNPIITLYAANDSTMVYGKEANGTIQFNGTISSLTWTIPQKEIYSVFTIGVTDTVGVAIPNSLWTGPTPTFPAIPEPSTYGIILGALALVGAAIRRRRQG